MIETRVEALIPLFLCARVNISARPVSIIQFIYWKPIEINNEKVPVKTIKLIRKMTTREFVYYTR